MSAITPVAGDMRRSAFRLRLAPPIESVLEQSVGDVARVLDVGCGANSPLGRFTRRYEHTVGIDLFPATVEKANAAGTHDEYRVMDVLDAGDEFAPGSFDACVAFDLIEHLPEGDGRKLLAIMERIASRRVVIFTPNGFLPQDAGGGNPFQVHRSGWTAKQFADLGYTVQGVNGLRLLRGHKGSMRFRPRRAWGVVSDLTQPLVRRQPRLAFHLLATKEL